MRVWLRENCGSAVLTAEERAGTGAPWRKEVAMVASRPSRATVIVWSQLSTGGQRRTDFRLPARAMLRRAQHEQDESGVGLAHALSVLLMLRGQLPLGICPEQLEALS